MDQQTTTTPDGITIYLATGATLWHPSEYQAHTQVSVTDITACAAHPLDDGLPHSGWEYQENRPWTWQTTSLHVPRVVAGYDPADQDAVAAAVDYIARYARLDLTRSAALAARHDRELRSAHAAAERVRARLASTGYGYEREQPVRQSHELGSVLLERGILTYDEITEVCAILGRTPERRFATEVPPLYYGVADVAAARGVKRGTIDRYLADGRLPLPDVTSGSTQLWEAETIEEWITADIERR